MANRYSVGGRSAATAATADQSAGHLWNPHATKSIYVREIWFFKTVATVDNPGLVRTTTIGTTPGTTVTPDADNAFDRRAAPPSVSVLYLAAFATYPVIAGPYMHRENLPAAIGAGLVWSFYDEPIEVPAGTGLAVATPVAVILQPADLTFVWDE
jgi:hypothetical protein